ncbi:MAG: hypothetical protein ABIH23_25360 [bacterium]
MTEARKHKTFLVVAFLVIIYAVGITQALVELREGDNPQFLDLFLQKPTEHNLRTFENDLENTSWFSQTSQPWMRYLQFIVLKDTGDKAIMGRDGWFFYRPGVRYLIEPWPQRSTSVKEKTDPVSAILSFRDQLSERGIQLLVVPAPGKASIYPEKLTLRAKDTNRIVYTHTREIIEALKETDVAVFDLFHAFSTTDANNSEYYLSQDTHWSPAGMSLAAVSIAQRILGLGWVEKGNIEYRLEPVTFDRYGDVLEMLSIPYIDRMYRPEKIRCQQVVRGDTGEPYRDEQNSEILVLGDSFLRIYERDEPGSAGFVAHLAYELKTPLTSIINDGGASTLVRQELSRKPQLLDDKKIVIWEFVERDIRFGIEGWQNIPLPHKTQNNSSG